MRRNPLVACAGFLLLAACAGQARTSDRAWAFETLGRPVPQFELVDAEADKALVRKARSDYSAGPYASAKEIYPIGKYVDPADGSTTVMFAIAMPTDVRVVYVFDKQGAIVRRFVRSTFG